MKKQPIIWGIILVLLLSSLSSTVMGFDAEKVDMSMQSVDGPMDSPWPMKCHDTKHTGRSPYSTADNNGAELWKFETDNWIEGGAVIDNENNIYFGSFDGYVYSLYPNGTLRWKYEIGDWIWSTPAINEDGVLYIGSYDTKLYALYLNGTIKWKFNAGGTISSSPAIGVDGTIYFGIMKGFDKGDVIAVTPDGEEKWRYETDYKVVSDPAIADDGTIYIGSGDTYFYAIYPNGTLRWRFKTGDIVKSHPSITKDGSIYFSSFDTYLYALNPNGTLKWKFKDSYGGASSVSIDNEGVLYDAGINKLNAIYSNGTLKWSCDLGNINLEHSSPAISKEGIIYVGAGKNIIAINQDGMEIWRRKIATHWVESSPCIGLDGTVYIGSSSLDNYGAEYGYLYAFGEGNNPPIKPTITGPSSGKAGNSYNYTIVSTDPDGDNITYSIDWGLGLLLAYGPYESGEEITLNHTWSEEGNYAILVKAKDPYGGESELAVFQVSMPNFNNINNSLFTRFLNFKLLFLGY
jgi:outer membrane protein assembly factor BamB